MKTDDWNREAKIADREAGRVAREAQKAAKQADRTAQKARRPAHVYMWNEVAHYLASAAMEANRDASKSELYRQKAADWRRLALETEGPQAPSTRPTPF